MWLLGVDVGGSKSLAIVTDEHGTCCGVGLAGGGNFQLVGIERASEAIGHSIRLALDDAGIRVEQVSAAFSGVAGADRPRDFEVVRRLLAPHMPPGPWDCENDALLGIWAQFGSNVGVSVVCGSGTNVLGFNRHGQRVQVGGMGFMFGDYAGGNFIATLAIRAAMRSVEGRGPATSLYEKLCRHYGVDNLLDLIDERGRTVHVRLDGVTPIVFEAAAEGDAVAQNILVDVGRDLGVSANAAIARLFDPAEMEPSERVRVVAMGSVFQKATYPLMYDTFVDTMRARFGDMIQVSILRTEPVLGAIYAAARMAGVPMDEAFRRRLEQTFPGRPVVPTR